MSESGEAKWLDENWEMILRQYGNEWVAVYGHEIVAHDKDFEIVVAQATNTTSGEQPLYAFVEPENEL